MHNPGGRRSLVARSARVVLVLLTVWLPACSGCVGNMEFSDDAFDFDFGLDGMEFDLNIGAGWIGPIDGGGGGGGDGDDEESPTDPTITGVSPDRVRPGDVVVLSGLNLNYYTLSVEFPGAVTKVLEWGYGNVKVRVPPGATSGYVTASVDGVAGKGAYVEIYPRPVDSCPASGANSCPAGTAPYADGCGYAGAQTNSVDVRVLDFLTAMPVSAATIHPLEPTTLGLSGICGTTDGNGRVALRVESGKPVVSVIASFDAFVDTYAYWPGAPSEVTMQAVSLAEWRMFGASAGVAVDTGKGFILGTVLDEAGQPPGGSNLWGIQTNAGTEALYYPDAATLPAVHSVQTFIHPANGRFALLNMPPGPVALRVTEGGVALPSTHSTVAKPYSATITEVVCNECNLP